MVQPNVDTMLYEKDRAVHVSAPSSTVQIACLTPKT